MYYTTFFHQNQAFFVILQIVEWFFYKNKNGENFLYTSFNQFSVDFFDDLWYYMGVKINFDFANSKNQRKAYDNYEQANHSYFLCC